LAFLARGAHGAAGYPPVHCARARLQSPALRTTLGATGLPRTTRMEMHGERRIPAPRGEVWARLNDPETLKECIPGCQSVEKLSDTEFTAKVTAKVGPVRANFAGKVTLSDLDPPAGYTITGEGTGGVAGFAKGGAKVTLAEEGGETILRYGVEAQIGGKLAQVGSRLIDGVARKMADDFFTKFVNVMSPPPPPAASD
jgi:uncharacterized protein